MIYAKFDANWSNCLGRVRKSLFFIYGDFCEWKSQWAWCTPSNSAESREHADIRFNNVQHIMWELWAKNAFALKTVPPAGNFWGVSYKGQSTPPV